MPALIKLVLTDIDGVWTDGGMYYGDDGTEWKKFNTSDSAGVLFCQMNAIEVGILTGENTSIVSRRAEKLRIGLVSLGDRHKRQTADAWRRARGLSWDEVAYIGDDINDLALLQVVGFSASVPNAPAYIRENVRFVTQKHGGEGAFREFVEQILARDGRWADTLRRIQTPASDAAPS